MRSGVITACLKSFGISPVSMDRLTILAIIGISSDVYYFSSEVGIGSKTHDLDGDFKTIFWIFSTDTCVNCDSLGTTKCLVSYLSKA